jgi:hypothetical protein
MSQEKKRKTDDSTITYLLETTAYDSLEQCYVKKNICVGRRVESLYYLIFK